MWLFRERRSGTNKAYNIYTAEPHEAEVIDVNCMSLTSFESIFYNPHCDQKIIIVGDGG